MKPVSKWLFLGLVGALFVIADVLQILALLSDDKSTAGGLGFAAIVAAAGAGGTLLVLMYKAWAAIQDGHARVSPSSAIVRMLIPLFNLYWIFQLFWGFAKDYNAYLDRHDVSAGKVNEGVFLFYSAVNAVVWIPGYFVVAPSQAGGGTAFLYVVIWILLLVQLVLGLSVVSATCEAINSVAYLATRRSAAASGG